MLSNPRLLIHIVRTIRFGGYLFIGIICVIGVECRLRIGIGWTFDLGDCLPNIIVQTFRGLCHVRVKPLHHCLSDLSPPRWYAGRRYSPVPFNPPHVWRHRYTCRYNAWVGCNRWATLALGSGPVPTIVAKTNDGPRVCADYRLILIRHSVRKIWFLPGLDTCLDALSSAGFLSPSWTSWSRYYSSGRRRSTLEDHICELDVGDCCLFTGIIQLIVLWRVFITWNYCPDRWLQRPLIGNYCNWFRALSINGKLCEQQCGCLSIHKSHAIELKTCLLLVIIDCNRCVDCNIILQPDKQ